MYHYHHVHARICYFTQDSNYLPIYFKSDKELYVKIRKNLFSPNIFPLLNKSPFARLIPLYLKLYMMTIIFYGYKIHD
jgi:hypothetical protein